MFAHMHDVALCGQRRIQSWTWGGHNPELDFGEPQVSFSYEKFPNTIACSRKHCHFGGSSPPGSAPVCGNTVKSMDLGHSLVGHPCNISYTQR